MTDKQIIIDVRKCKEHGLRNCEGKLIHWCHTYDDHCQDFNDCYYKQLKRKEQEYDQLKAENDELKEIRDSNFLHALEEQKKANKLKQTLTEIKPILEYYANSTIGEEQEDGTYHIELSYKYGSSNMYGAPCYYKYNPKPARQALQKISECEGNND